MKRKTNNIPDFKHASAVPMPSLKEAKSVEKTTADTLAAIRQLEPEDQNKVVENILKELALDRHNSVRQNREAADRASKNMDVFMYTAIHLEKIMAEANDKKGL